MKKEEKRLAEKRMDAMSLAKTMKQNAEYEEMEMARRIEKTLQVKHDLEQQIQLKNCEKVYFLYFLCVSMEFH